MDIPDFDTLQALVDAIIPRTPELALQYGNYMYYGALDFQTVDYVIWTLNFYPIPLANAFAEVIDISTRYFIDINENKRQADYLHDLQNETFSSLQAPNRLYVLSLLEKLEFPLIELPYPFNSQEDTIISLANTIIRIIFMGYYSEWYGYGDTKFNSPSQRVFQFSPLSWTQAGYPGPSFSYRNEAMEYLRIRRRDYEL